MYSMRPMNPAAAIALSLLLSAAGAAAPGTARAQDMINNLPDYTGAWYLGHIMQYRGDEDDEARPAKQQPDAKKAAPVGKEEPSMPEVDPGELLAQATYTPSQRMTAKIDAAFADYLGGQQPAAQSSELLRALAMDNPPGSPFARLLAGAVGAGTPVEILHELESGGLQHDYARWLSSMGYSDRNLFDVHTAFLMHSWAVANGGIMTADSRDAFAAVRGDLLDLQSRPGAPRLISRDDARKQQEAQSFALLTALLVSAWERADAGDKAVLSTGVAALGRRIGVDYGKVALTRDGFVGKD